MTSKSLILEGDQRAESSEARADWPSSISDPHVLRRIAREGLVGMGESYEEGLWSADHLDQVLLHAFHSAPRRMSLRIRSRLLLTVLEQRVFNRQVGRRAFNIGTRHYDLGNDLFRCMLDESMTYTSGYWATARTLKEAQTAKLDLLCRKINLQPGQHVLDIGCGWGNFAEHAACRYGARVTGLTVSKEQADFARSRCGTLPVEIRLQDYREVEETFDHVVSIEMIEAVGRKNLPTYFRVIDRSLKDGGSCALQVISADTLSRTSDPRLDQFIIWILQNIFPNGYLPKQDELVPPRDTSLRIDSWHRFTDDYDRTLMSWASRCNQGWEQLGEQYDERFRRRWMFYLYGCAAAFRAGLIGVSQIVYAKSGSLGCR